MALQERQPQHLTTVQVVQGEEETLLVNSTAQAAEERVEMLQANKRVQPLL